MNKTVSILTRETSPFLAADVVGLASIVVVALLTAQSTMAVLHPEILGPAIAIDLTITAAVVHYFLGVRRGKLPMLTMLPVLGSGWLVANLFLPESLRPAGSLPVIAAAIFEGVVVVVAVLRLRTLVRAFVEERKIGGNRFEAIEAGMRAVVPRLPFAAIMVRTEIELLFFATAGFFIRGPAPTTNEFSHHKKVQWSVLAVVFAGLSVVEGGLVHLILVSNEWMTAALFAGGLHAYGLVFIFGDAHAARIRRTKISADSIRISLGIRAEANVPLEAIEDVTIGEWSAKDLPAGTGRAQLFGAMNVRMTLRSPVEFRRAYSARREVTEIFLQLDEPQAFADVVKSRLKPFATEH